MDGVMFGFIKYENLLLGAFLFSLFTLMYCVILHIKIQLLGAMLVKVNHNIKIGLKLNLDVKDQLKDIDIKE
jgi:hypothetical protein